MKITKPDSIDELYLYLILERYYLIQDDIASIDMHVQFEWSNNKEYDILVQMKNGINLLIELNGASHYQDCLINNYDHKSILVNDAYKKDTAFNNGYNEDTYIEIDTQKKSFCYVTDNIKQSKLNKYINFDLIDNELNDLYRQARTDKNKKLTIDMNHLRYLKSL